jgi:hypothetical protein
MSALHAMSKFLDVRDFGYFSDNVTREQLEKHLREIREKMIQQNKD